MVVATDMVSTPSATPNGASPDGSESGGPQPPPSSEQLPRSERMQYPPEPPEGKVRLFLWRVVGLLITMRPHQWVKNVFVLGPVVFAREMFVADLLVRSIGALGVFCLLAGAVYTMNDLVDLEGDAAHPIKRFRPLASGRVPLQWGRRAAFALVLISLIGAAIGPWEFLLTAIAYFVLNIAYSFRLKRIAYLDVSLIAFGFVLRVLAGGFATHTEVSAYMVLCTALLALFLGLGKRRHELVALGKRGKQRAALGGYTRRGLDWALTITAVLTVGCYVAYTFDPATVAFFHSDDLWWTTIFVVLGVWRFITIARSRPRAESPTQEMLRDGPFVAILFSWIFLVLWIVYNLEPG